MKYYEFVKFKRQNIEEIVVYTNNLWQLVVVLHTDNLLQCYTVSALQRIQDS